MGQAGLTLRMIERRNQTPQLGCIETRLYFDLKSLREHHPKLSAPPRAPCLPHAPEHLIIVNDFEEVALGLDIAVRFLPASDPEARDVDWSESCCAFHTVRCASGVDALKHVIFTSAKASVRHF